MVGNVHASRGWHAETSPRGSVLPAVAVFLVVVGAITLALLQMASYAQQQAVNEEMFSRLKESAVAGVHFQKTRMFYGNSSQFVSWLGHSADIKVNGISVALEVLDDDDDSDPGLDSNGKLILRSTARQGESWYTAEVIVQLKRFSEYSCAWKSSLVYLGQYFESTGNVYILGDATESGEGVLHHDWVTLGGSYTHHNGYYSTFGRRAIEGVWAGPAYVSGQVNETYWARDTFDDEYNNADGSPLPDGKPDPGDDGVIESLAQGAESIEFPSITSGQWAELRTTASEQGRLFTNASSFQDGLGQTITPENGVELYLDGSTGNIWIRAARDLRGDVAWDTDWQPMVDGAVFFFDCDVYIRGQFDARLSIATAGDIIIQNDLVWENQQEDTLGLMAQNDIIFEARVEGEPDPDYELFPLSLVTETSLSRIPAAPIPIPDGGTASDAQTTTVDDALESVYVSYHISHASPSDLQVVLSHGGIDHVVLDYGAAVGTDVNVDQQDVSAAFAGQPASGAWTLTVSDQTVGVQGTLVRWDLMLSTPREYKEVGEGYLGWRTGYDEWEAYLSAPAYVAPAVTEFPYAQGYPYRNYGFLGYDAQVFASMYAGNSLGTSQRWNSNRLGTLYMLGSQSSGSGTSNAFGNTYDHRIYGYNPMLRYFQPPHFIYVSNTQPVFALGSWTFTHS